MKESRLKVHPASQVSEGSVLSGADRRRLTRLCGNTFPAEPIMSLGSRIVVTFRSNAQNNYNGFAALFNACKCFT